MNIICYDLYFTLSNKIQRKSMITFREFLSSLFDLSLSVFELRNQPLQISVQFVAVSCNGM